MPTLSDLQFQVPRFGSRRSAALLCLAMLAAIVPLALPRTTSAQDYQEIAVGNGAPNAECVKPGPNGNLNSVPAGDDFLVGLTTIVSGNDGICDTPLSGDDVRPSGIVQGHGKPNQEIILSGRPGPADDGICSDNIVALGDDAVRIPQGSSEPYVSAIVAGANGTVESTASDDDLLTGVICPGGDGVIQTIPTGGDVLSVVSSLCSSTTLCNAPACIIPGPSGVLQSTTDPADVRKPFISTGADGIAQSTAVGDDLQAVPVGRGTPRTICVDSGADGIAQTTICGNGVADTDENGIANDEECDDGNPDSGDGCSAICQVERCGDGIVQAPGEECDDGNGRNTDACVVGCKLATCGDGFLRSAVEECEPPDTPVCDATCQTIVPPRCGDRQVDAGEECDDGNQSNLDDCLNNCRSAVCGDGGVHTKGTAPFEECDDGNTVPGDGCSAICTKQCGNGLIDGHCIQGLIGQVCATNGDCDSSSPGDGICEFEECDPGAAALCGTTPPICSNVCKFATCGNGEVECSEECDLGAQNGAPGTACTATCTAKLVGNEKSGRDECLTAWTLENAPADRKKTTQICLDGQSCDADMVVDGQCTFRVGLCLNRSGVSRCTPGSIVTVELEKVDVSVGEQAALAEALTSGIQNLTSSGAQVPGRCQKGLVGKVCSIPDNNECDTSFAAGDGLCNVGTGVAFSPTLEPVGSDLPGSQLQPCTGEVNAVVPVGSKLKLKVTSRRVNGRSDKDQLTLSCK